ncbi:MAG: PKD domain-containing protein [Methylomicrobium sp.]
MTWASSATAVATINSSGLASGVSAGSTTITATSGSVSSTTTLRVNPIPNKTVSPTPNKGPTANAGSDQTVQAGTLVTLNGSASTDPDNGPSSLTYSWSQISGPTLTLNGATTVQSTFTPLTPGIYTFSLVVNDGNLSSLADEVTVTVNGADSVVIQSPNGGETLATGSNVLIQWVAPITASSFKPITASSFKLAYSCNGGSTWTRIATNVSDYAYGWTVPTLRANKTNCRVRVTGLDSQGRVVGKDVSDAPFTNEVVKLLFPNGGETFTAGATTSINWLTHQTKVPVARTVLRYTINGGRTWKVIARLTGNPGTYAWLVPSVLASSPHSRVSITLLDSSGLSLGKDTSDGEFGILSPP